MTKENKKISKHYILFVDDEPQIVDYFKMTLEEDFNIFTALNIEDAKKILSEKSEQISVVITDQRMPGGNGVLLLAHLKDNYPDIIRILTTAYSDLDEAINSVNKGEIYRYIQKPWDFESLKTEIRQAEELFMLRLNCNLLLRQKFTSKIKVNKINRLRYLFLIAQNLNFIKNSEAAIVDFCHFANDIDEKSEINIDFSKMDMGNDDIVENKLLLDISRKILTTLDYKNNYDNNIANYNKNDLISVIDNENANIDLSNELCFNKDILKILFSNINYILLENQIHSYNIKN